MVSSRNAASLRGRRRRGPDPSGTTGGAGGGGGPGRWRPSSRPGPDPESEQEDRDPEPVPTVSGLSTPTGALGVREVRRSCEFSILVPPRFAARVIPSTYWPLRYRLTSR